MANRDPALIRAIRARHTSADLARAVGISPQALSQWRRVPADRVIAVELASGVDRAELRPDLYLPRKADMRGVLA